MICAATVRQQGWSLSAPARITSQQPSCCRLSVQCHLHLAKANPNGCTTLKWNRWRDVGQAGSLRGGWLPPLSAAIAAVGRLTIGRSLPSCPTGAPPAWRTTYAQMQALFLADESRRRPLSCRPPLRKVNLRAVQADKVNGRSLGSSYGVLNAISKDFGVLGRRGPEGEARSGPETRTGRHDAAAACCRQGVAQHRNLHFGFRPLRCAGAD